MRAWRGGAGNENTTEDCAGGDREKQGRRDKPQGTRDKEEGIEGGGDRGIEGRKEKQPPHLAWAPLRGRGVGRAI